MLPPHTREMLWIIAEFQGFVLEVLPPHTREMLWIIAEFHWLQNARWSSASARLSLASKRPLNRLEFSFSSFEPHYFLLLEVRMPPKQSLEHKVAAQAKEITRLLAQSTLGRAKLAIV
jgi:hypothetical protein